MGVMKCFTLIINNMQLDWMLAQVICRYNYILILHYMTSADKLNDTHIITQLPCQMLILHITHA